MRTLQVPYGFDVGRLGGTEVCVAGLAQALAGHGDEAVLAAPALLGA